MIRRKLHIFHQWTDWEPVQISKLHFDSEGLAFWVPGERRHCRNCPKVQRRQVRR